MKDFNKRLIETIRMEKENHIRSGVYGLTQREFAYNSNKIEGSRLTKEHTASLFDTGSIYMEGVFRGKDVEEASGHFAMFNEMLNSLEKPLSETVIKEFHRYLKQGVFEDIANGYAIGEYKKRKNYVGDIETAAPEEVADKIKALLKCNAENILLNNCKISVLAKRKIKELMTRKNVRITNQKLVL